MLASVAQPVEQLICNQRVGGSNPFAGSGLERRLSLKGTAIAGRYQSGQMGRAVNPLRQRFGGSNPSLPIFNAGIAQLVERQPSKLNVAGSSPVSRSLRKEVKPK